MKRIPVALLAAYAASMTLVASNRIAEGWLYRRCFEALYRGKHGRPSDYPGLLPLAEDFGLPLAPPQYWALRLADLRRWAEVPLIALFFLAGLGAVAWSSRPPRPKPDKD